MTKLELEQMQAFEEFYCKANTSPALNNTYRENRLRFDMFLYKNDAMRIDKDVILGVVCYLFGILGLILMSVS